MRVSTVQHLRDRGFDDSEAVPFETRWRVRCSQCAAAVIQGLACHETGCPNARDYQTLRCGWNGLGPERDWS